MPLYKRQHTNRFVSLQHLELMDINIKIGDRIRELRKEKFVTSSSSKSCRSRQNLHDQSRKRKKKCNR